MALVGKVDSCAVYVKQFEWKKIWLTPAMTSNGTWMAEGYSCQGSGLDSLNNLYQVFNGTYTNYLNKFNENTWIEICLPEATEIAGCYMTSSDGYFPATGDISYSDDGTTYTKCGSWTDTSNSKNVTAYVTKGSGAHRIWRFTSTGRASAHTSSNADISTVKLFTEEKVALALDNTLPEGAAGRASTFVTHHPYQGLHLAPLQVFFTYKQDDKINLWEGTDSAIKGFASATVNYRPHDGVDVTPQAMLVNYRKHDGVDINKVLPFYLQRLEDGSTIYTVPNGIGGLIQPFITQRIVQSCSYLNDIDMGRVQGIAIQNAYFPLKGIKAMNGVPILNNNTTDQ